MVSSFTTYITYLPPNLLFDSPSFHIIEYCSPVWSPSSVSLSINSLESIQSFALNLAFHFCSSPPPVPSTLPSSPYPCGTVLNLNSAYSSQSPTTSTSSLYTCAPTLSPPCLPYLFFPSQKLHFSLLPYTSSFTKYFPPCMSFYSGTHPPQSNKLILPSFFLVI